MLRSMHGGAASADLDKAGSSEAEDLYFAYGTDLDPDVLRGRGGRPEIVTVARLNDYRLAFFGHTEIWDSGMETVVPAPRNAVWGAIYRMGPLDWDRLDTWMDARMDGAGRYFHYPATVVDREGTFHDVRLYKKDIQGAPTPPSRDYLELLVRGARQQGLPTEYVERLQQFVARTPRYPVPMPGNLRRGIPVGTDCGTCAAGAPDRSPED